MQMMASEYKIEQPKRGLRKSFLLFGFLLLVLALVAVIYYLTKVNRAATDVSHENNFSVARG